MPRSSLASSHSFPFFLITSTQAAVLHSAAMHIEALNAENLRLQAELKAAFATTSTASIARTFPSATLAPSSASTAHGVATTVMSADCSANASGVSVELPSTPPPTPRADLAALSSAIFSASSRTAPAAKRAKIAKDAPSVSSGAQAASVPTPLPAPTPASSSATGTANLELIFHAIERVESGQHVSGSACAATPSLVDSTALRRSPRKCGKREPAGPGAPSRRLELSSY